ncbi:hypothetical protein K7640_20375 [Micromonospora sp. PLK6-60]|uniref:hypothetical protein n=1 Tax=Micromonospora sp. PLK6-60 TaxID=2873383 RepID=UPI001CA77941|nr:hypothetical protein [Micromonospora sp. PLK6-60]MBY8874188.1 hypothetical protein [Micromonospora sp. PLK6-60]
MTEREATADLLREFLGRRVVTVTEARHWPDGRPPEEEPALLHFWLHVEGGAALMFHGAGDHLRLSRAQPYPAYEMGEYGRVRVAAAQPPGVLASFAERPLDDAALLYLDADRRSPSGVRLRFPGDDLIVASVGDEWLIEAAAAHTDPGWGLTSGPWLREAAGDAMDVDQVGEGALADRLRAARDAESRADWATAIALLAPVAECYSADHARHHAHLWHLDLLARTGRRGELAALARTDVHARRRLSWLSRDEPADA